ncbi:MAG: DUF1573 domain-containing protein [Ignavibacteriae bacterium]|nr:DUF1573 domain-containing protein [Ignavibacteriota bacterium]
MKYIAILFFLFVSTNIAQFNGPKIVAEEPKFNFGDIVEGDIVTHKFVVHNKGGADLTISKVKASCGCTAAQPENNVIAPFASTTIEVSFDSKRRGGKQRKYVYVFSDDPNTPQLRLQFTANILPHKLSNVQTTTPQLKLSKYNHNFGDVKEGSVHDFSVMVTNVGTGVLNIKNIKASCGCTAVMMDNKKIKSKESSQLRIEFDSSQLSGQIARTITLETNDSKYPLKVVTLIANVI